MYGRASPPCRCPFHLLTTSEELYRVKRSDSEFLWEMRRFLRAWRGGDIRAQRSHENGLNRTWKALRVKVEKVCLIVNFIFPLFTLTLWNFHNWILAFAEAPAAFRQKNERSSLKGCAVVTRYCNRPKVVPVQMQFRETPTRRSSILLGISRRTKRSNSLCQLLRSWLNKS